MHMTAMQSKLDFPNIVQWTLSGQYDPDRPVLFDAVNPRRRVTKSKATTLIAQLAGSFTEDSTVCIHLANDVLYPILCMAIYASRCRWTGTNIAYTATELEHHFRTSETRYVITAEEHLNTVRAAVDCSGTRAEIIVFSDILSTPPPERDFTACCGQGQPKRQFPNLHDLLKNQTPESLFATIRDIDVDSIATLMPTSGTTGLPKMAARTHRAIVLETARAMDNHSAKPYEVRRLYCTPMFHSFSAPEMIINSLRLGFPAYYMKRFDDVIFPQKIREFNITETLAPPPMILRLVNNPDARNHIQSLKTVYTGGAPLVSELKTKFTKMFVSNPPAIAQVWGMTEGGWFTTMKYPDADGASVGRPIEGFDIKVGPNHYTTLSGGQNVGELYVKSDTVMSHYWGNEEETKRAFEGQWLRTGDVGYIDNDMVYLVDRAKDLIKVNGWQVSPVEIEDALLVSPLVKDVGVIGIGLDVNEHPMAFVVLADDNANISKDDLKCLLTEHLLQRLARYKVVKCKFQIIDAVPRNASGKILKKHLRQLARA